MFGSSFLNCGIEDHHPPAKLRLQVGYTKKQEHIKKQDFYR